MQKVIIFGANSAIAEATARMFAKSGASLFLVARDSERLETLSADLQLRGASKVGSACLDMNELEKHSSVLTEAKQCMDGVNIALIAHGTLSNQQECERDFQYALQELNTNQISTMSILSHIANDFQSEQKGTIAVISSVAGDRGRQSNYLYGTAKGAISLYCQGLRNRLFKSNVHVVTVKPGFVDTPMTADMKKGILWANPQQIASGIMRAIKRKKDVVYLPWFWRYIMMIIRTIPESLFKRLSL